MPELVYPYAPPLIRGADQWRPNRSLDNIIGNGYVGSTGAFTRASTAYYTDITAATAAVNVPRFEVPTTAYNFQPDEIRAIDRAASSQSATYMARSMGAYQQLVPGAINLYILYGQSNSKAYQAFPQIRIVPVSGALMLGSSVHGDGTNNAFVPIGSSTPSQLIATTLDASQTTVLSQAVAGLLDYTVATNYGETIGDAAIQLLRTRLLAADASDTRQVALVTCGWPSTLAAELVRGASPNYFNRITTAIAAWVAAAGGTPVRVCGVIIAQGESDNTALTPINTWRSTWSGIISDIMTYAITPNIPAQTKPPCIFWQQIGDLGNTVNSSSSFAQNQVDFANLNNWPITCRTGTSKGLHFDPNGAAASSISLFRSIWRASVLGYNIAPAAIYQPGVSLRGRELIIPFTSPAAIRYRQTYQQYVLSNRADWGITSTDSGGVMGAPTIQIVGGQTIRVIYPRDPVSGSMVVGIGYRDVSGGKNNIGINNAEATGFKYEYITGMNAAANIPALVGNELDVGDYALLGEMTVNVP